LTRAPSTFSIFWRSISSRALISRVAAESV
jgi:hypothetical protein